MSYLQSNATCEKLKYSPENKNKLVTETSSENSAILFARFLLTRINYIYTHNYR